MYLTRFSTLRRKDSWIGRTVWMYLYLMMLVTSGAIAKRNHRCEYLALGSDIHLHLWVTAKGTGPIGVGTGGARAP